MNRSRIGAWLLPWLLLVSLPALATNYNVSVGPNGDLAFSPKTLTINVGDSVTWQFGGDPVMPHNIVAPGLFRCAQGCDNEGGNGNPSNSAWTVTRTFNTAGTVNYFCELHRALGMTGTITVNASSAVTIGPGFTGAWYDPNQNRHGLFVEVLPENKFLAWWFAFNPEGTQQSWFGGVGTYSGNTATITGVNMTIGGRWIPNFDITKTTDVPWGTLTFTFSDCNTGRVDFVSTVPGYGTNHMDLTRLTQPAGLTCP